MKNSFRSLVALGLMIGCLAAANKAMAIPTLQLDIAGGTYDSSTQTIVSSGDVFTLYAYLITNSSNTLDDTYFITAALSPKVSSTEDLGSFTVNGSQVNATSDMTYGVPPIDTVYSQLHDAGDLADHGIFDTYFKQFDFQFNSSNVSGQYNTQDDTGQGPISGTGMYYMAFNVDTSGLSSDYVVHFDLYNTKLCANSYGKCDGSGDVDITKFAPFSHDAESGHAVPEPSTLLLLGSGLVGLGLFGRRRKG